MNSIIKNGLFLAILVGILVPGIGNFSGFLPYILSTMLFFSFLKISGGAKNFLRKELLYYFILIFIISPIFVFYLTKFAGFETDLRLGIFIAVITPTAIGAPVIVDMINGDRELAVSSLVAANLFSPISYSILLNLFFSGEIMVPTKDIFLKILAIVFAPLIAALLVKRFKNIKRKLISGSKKINPLLLIFGVTIAVSSSATKLKDIPASDIFFLFVFIIFVVVGLFSFGYLISKKEKTRKALGSVFGQKNTALAIWIALENFGKTAAIPVLIYIICHHLVNSFLIKKFG